MMSKAMILLVGLLTMVVAQGEWENNAFVNTSKTVTRGEKLVNCWVCHKNPGLQQQFQVRIGTYNKSIINSNTWKNLPPPI